MDNIKLTWFLFGRQSGIPEEYATMSHFGFYRFYYVCDGESYFRDENGTIRLEKGNVYLLPRKSYALTTGESKYFYHIWGHFQIEGWQFNNVIKINLSDDPIFQNYVSLIQQMAEVMLHNPNEQTAAYDMITLFSDERYFPVMSETVSAFVTYLYLNLHHHRENKSTLEAVVDYINRNLSLDLSNEALAQIAQYSRAHFIQEFTHAYGIPPQKYVVKARISQAIVMLMNNEKVYHIAYKIGYDNPKSFARAFKRETGLSPQKYKEIHYLNVYNTSDGRR